MHVLFRRLASPSVLACRRRTISTSPLLREEEDLQKQQHEDAPKPEPLSNEVQEGAEEFDDPPHEDGSGIISYKTWLQNLADGQWKTPKGSRNWMASDTPYPGNPSFRPPRPVSDETRSQIYSLFMKDPITNNLHELSARFHLSLKRVEAILRLKGLEAHWLEGKTLQTGFQYGMEQLLDAKGESRPAVVDDPTSDANVQMAEADTEDQEGGRERELARQRYQRFFFESVAEGEEPIMPSMLQKAKDNAAAVAEKGRTDKTAEDVMPTFPNFLNNPPKVHYVEREGRPAMKFIDVAGRFLDVDERRERMKQAERRRRLKDKKRSAAAAAMIEERTSD